MEKLDKFCLICKSRCDSRYIISVIDSDSDTITGSNTCTDCYNRLFQNGQSSRFFSSAKKGFGQALMTRF